MLKMITLSIICILIVVSAAFLILMPSEQSDLPPSVNTVKPIRMPKPPPEPVNPPVVSEPEKQSEEKFTEQTKEIEGEMPKNDTAPVSLTAVTSESETATIPPRTKEEGPGAGDRAAAAEKAEDKVFEPVDAETEKTGEGVKDDIKEEKNTPAVEPAKKQDEAAPLSESSITRELKDIQVQTGNGKVDVILQADGPLKGFKYFFLIDPERLVIDLTGDWARPQSHEKIVENDLIQKIRLWKYPDKLRIVCDLKEKKPLSPGFTETPDGLIVTLMNSNGGMPEKQPTRTE